MQQEIKITYKNARIIFDTEKEEWVASLNTEYSSDDEFKRHTSLQKLKDAIDRFNKKEFKPIRILIERGYGGDSLEPAEIISFTETPGECWIRYKDSRGEDRRERINTIKTKYGSSKRIYACENVGNEPILLQINSIEAEIEKSEKDLAQKRKEKIHLMDTLQTFDIGGYAVATEELS